MLAAHLRWDSLESLDLIVPTCMEMVGLIFALILIGTDTTIDQFTSLYPSISLTTTYTRFVVSYFRCITRQLAVIFDSTISASQTVNQINNLTPANPFSSKTRSRLGLLLPQSIVS